LISPPPIRAARDCCSGKQPHCVNFICIKSGWNWNSVCIKWIITKEMWQIWYIHFIVHLYSECVKAIYCYELQFSYHRPQVLFGKLWHKCQPHPDKCPLPPPWFIKIIKYLSIKYVISRRQKYFESNSVNSSKDCFDTVYILEAKRCFSLLYLRQLSVKGLKLFTQKH